MLESGSEIPCSTPLISTSLMPQEEKLEIGKKFKKLTIGIPKENQHIEKRVGLTPEAIEVLVEQGHDVIIEDKAGDVPYYFYTKRETEPKNLIFVEDGFSNPQIKEISEVSAAVRGLQKVYQIHRVCFPPELKEEIAELYHRKNA